MLYSEYMVKESMTKLVYTNKFIKKDFTVDANTKSKIYGLCFDLMLAFEEEYFEFKDYNYKDNKETVKEVMNNISKTEDAEEIKKQIERITNLRPENYDYDHLGLYEVNRSSYSAITKESNLINQSVRRLATLVRTGRSMNILDPKCGEGDNAAILKNAIKNSIVYGIEQDEYSAEEARSKIDKIAKGALTGSRISNEVFDFMFLRLPITWQINNTYRSLLNNQEKKYIHDTSKYVRDNGVITYIIPFFRVYKEIAIALSKTIKDVQIIRLLGTDFDEYGLVAIIGKKKETRELDNTTFKLLRRIRDIMDFPDMSSTDLNEYILPPDGLVVKDFRGSILDFNEMESIVENSGCLNEFWGNQKVEKLSECTKQPLLPFNVGQIGLVLTSGCLDGIVDEGNGKFHAIKGRVSKKSDIERNIVDGRIEVQETISNRVEINVIMPNGDYKILA